MRLSWKLNDKLFRVFTVDAIYDDAAGFGKVLASVVVRNLNREIVRKGNARFIKESFHRVHNRVHVVFLAFLALRADTAGKRFPAFVRAVGGEALAELPA